jgi:multidrug efflux system membrane fusion protein
MAAVFKDTIMKRVVKWAVFLVVAVAVIWFFGFRQASTQLEADKAKKGRMPTVAVANVIRADWQETAPALGTVTAFNSVQIRSRIEGQVQAVLFKEGQLVQQGQILLKIDSRPQQVALQQAQGQLAKDQALLANAEQDLKRFETLSGQGVIAAQQLDQQRSLLRQAQAAIKVDEALVANARLNVAYTQITAPVSGRIGLRQVDVGSYVRAGDANPLVTINQFQPIYVQFSLPENALRQVLSEQKKQKNVRVSAWDKAQQTRLAEGTLASIDNQMDASTGSIKMKAIFDNKDQSLFPNQFVNITIELQKLTQALQIPSAAIMRQSKGPIAYVVDAKNKAVLRSLSLGPARDDKVVVLSGVQEGERVVIDGLDKLKDGMTVKLPESKARAAP